MVPEAVAGISLSPSPRAIASPRSPRFTTWQIAPSFSTRGCLGIYGENLKSPGCCKVKLLGADPFTINSQFIQYETPPFSWVFSRLCSFTTNLSPAALLLSGFGLLGTLEASLPFPHQYRTDLSKVYFYEDFRNYGVTIPGMIKEGLNYQNDPIHSFRSEVNIEATKDGLIYLKPITTPGAKDFDILFQFNLRPNDEKKLGSFETRLQAGKGKSSPPSIPSPSRLPALG